jgi:hypothetical protein
LQIREKGFYRLSKPKNNESLNNQQNNQSNKQVGMTLTLSRNAVVELDG